MFMSILDPGPVMKKPKRKKKSRKNKIEAAGGSDMVCMSSDSSTDPETAAKWWHEAMGPQAVDQAVRQAISCCWMMLPEGKKTIEAVESEIRRLVDRALNNLKEDAQAFGIPIKPPSS